MKTLFKSAIGISAISFLAFSAPASAENKVITDAIARRDNLSSFYNAYINTGVVNELSPNVVYTVFAPTNEAFAELTQAEYPCLYSIQCRPEIADIVRNHIVPFEVNFNGPRMTGVHSIDDTNLSFSKLNNTYAVNGHEIESTNQLIGGMLYEIDGVIADPQELAYLTKLKYVLVQNVIITPQQQLETEPVLLYRAVPRDSGYMGATTRSYFTIEPAAR